jgi:hypothetical protein
VGSFVLGTSVWLESSCMIDHKGKVLKRIRSSELGMECLFFLGIARLYIVKPATKDSLQTGYRVLLS